MKFQAQPRIHRLPPAVAERIAAGEVIERPASVVKELVENSLDAGATEISIRLEDGGKSLIEVTDNGCGMSAEDLRICIERHATSKLQSLDDLDRIRTLGFRGEALPSISAVAEVRLISRLAEASTAYELIAGDVADRGTHPPEPQAITFGHFNNSLCGTQIQARGLFSQIPARLKFLKSAGAEVSQVREWVERLALAHPHVGFQIQSGERKLLQLRPQSELKRVGEILGDGEEYPVIFAETRDDPFIDRGLKMRVYWLQGLSSPQNRRMVQIVNSRCLRDRFLQQAVMSPFRQNLLPGQFPAVALFIDLNPAALDVNVHPTKSEVRFLDKNKIFQSIDALIREMILTHGAPGRVGISVPPSWNEALSQSSETRSELTPRYSREWMNPQTSSSLDSSQTLSLSSSAFQTQRVEEEPPPFQVETHSRTHSQFSLELPASGGPFSGPPKAILFHTYLLYEEGEELVLIDQHAAHERIRYEKLKHRMMSQTESLKTQALLLPETVRFSEQERPRVELCLGLLERVGFEAEIFGEETVLFRSVPADWGVRNLKVRLKNLLDRLIHREIANPSSEGKGEAPGENPLKRLPEIPTPSLLDETLFESLASEACHSSVRAGDPLSLVEAEQLTRDLFQCEHPWNCPHGRPTVVRMPGRKLEEWFQRK